MGINPIITGTQINYYFVCKRKLWLFSKNISMEQNSELVEIGSILHYTSYSRKRKEIQLEGIKIDFFEKNKGIIHEVKKSKSIKKAHIWQLKYYLFYFKQLGLELIGKINYPLIKRTETIKLNNDEILFLKKVINDISEILNNKIPDKQNKKICKKCSYFEFCYA